MDLINNALDELKLQAINELKNRLSNQKGINVAFDQISDANHFFTKSESDLVKTLDKYLKKETTLY